MYAIFRFKFSLFNNIARNDNLIDFVDHKQLEKSLEESPMNYPNIDQLSCQINNENFQT
jgi:hypothetical protein